VQLAFFGASGTTTKWYTADGTYTEYVEVKSGHNGNTGFIANASFVGDIDDLTLKVVNTGAISGATWTHGIGAPVAQTAVIDWNKETTAAGTTMLLPQGLTANKDITGVNAFESARNPYALNLDGASWAEVHDNASLDITSAITLEAWVKCGDELNAVYDHIFVKPTSTTWISPYGTYVLRLRENDVQWWFESIANAKSYSISLSGWNHLIVTKNGSAEILYINGSQVDTNTGSATMSSTIYDLLIATRTQYSTNEMIANQLALPRIYNRALTATEVARNYNADKSKFGL